MSAEGKWVQSPLGDYNSAITLCGFLNGLSEAETVALFNDRTYARLGYDAQWDTDCANLIAEGRIAGIDLGPAIERWAAEGAFMHTVNHPILRVLADFGRHVVERLGLEPRPLQPQLYLTDALNLRAHWPIYPELAHRLKVASNGYWFKAPKIVQNDALPQVYDLAEFVAGSFEAYAKHGRSALSCKALDNPAFRGLAPTRGGDTAPKRAAANRSNFAIVCEEELIER